MKRRKNSRESLKLNSMTQSNRLVIDTHGLIWHLGQSDRLPDRARKRLRDIDEGEAVGLVPVIVLAEAAYIFEKKRTKVSLTEVLEEIDSGDNYRILSFDREQLEKMVELKDVPEMHDRIIAAVADIEGAQVITKDEEMRKAESIETIWN